jgi:hypothetical protein
VTVSPLNASPGAHAPGGASHPLATPDELAFQRASTTPDYFGWLDHISSAAGCSHPVRLRGTITTVDQATGATLSAADTAAMPDGVIYKNCGNRRAAACRSCSTTYRRDAFQLIRAGLVGGKGVPATVVGHPAVFATFTAPGFGPVHTRRTSKTGQQIPCRPRRDPDPCPHGVDLRCDRVHADDENNLGRPLCLDCYDHRHQVVWNLFAGELWRRTRIGIERHLKQHAKANGIDPKTLRLSYGKVAEMQRRGVVHFHVIIRLDGVGPDDPDAVVPAPDGLNLLDLVAAIEHAAGSTAFTTPEHQKHPDGWSIEWGRQLDIRPVRVPGDREISDQMVAGYLAKYATKSTEAAGHLSRRLDRDTIDLYADPQGSHIERLIDACWTLGGYDPRLRLSEQHTRPYARLRRWAHMLGFGGHFLTKSRRYSITFRILRERRVVWRRTEYADAARQHDQETTLTVASLNYVGSGWLTSGDALLANTAAAMARERQRIGRIESQCQP